MHPRLFTVHPFGHDLTLHTYGVLLAIAFVVGLWIVGRLAAKSGIDPAPVMDLAVYSLIGGLVGARLMLLVVEGRYYWANPRELLSLLQSGGVFYGGLIGGLLVAFWYLRRHSMPGWASADILAPGVILGQSIGRLGCLAAGCCFGKPTSVPWAITFHDLYASRTVGTPMDTPVHPSQLYESIAAAVIFAFLVWLYGRKRFHGQVALAYVMLYSVARFVLEYWRGDSSRGFVLHGMLSTSQLIALLLFIGAAVLWPTIASRQRVTR
jgi:phosphatidylglycerol:prolipoprotein diacylglycerol transferase